MALLNEEIVGQLTEHFKDLKNDVHMRAVLDECPSCAETQSLCQEVAALNDKFDFKIVEKDSQQVKDFGITGTPVIYFVDDNDNDLRIRFNGIPAGHEFSAFITTLSELGGFGEEIPADLKARIESIDKPVNIKVFVTLACPHCSGAVAKAHLLALSNKNVHAEMIECGQFQGLAEQYNVSSVPKIVINEKHELIGNQPIDAFLDTIEKA